MEKTEEAKGRKRKKPVKQDMKDSSDTAGAAGPPAGEIDPITATIEAVLANAASIDTSVEKLKKMKRTKKCQEASKQDGEKSAEDDDNEDGSAAGNFRFYILSQQLFKSNADHVLVLSLKQGKLKAGGLQLRSKFSSHCNMGNVSYRKKIQLKYNYTILVLYWSFICHIEMESLHHFVLKGNLLYTNEKNKYKLTTRGRKGNFNEFWCFVSTCHF